MNGVVEFGHVGGRGAIAVHQRKNFGRRLVGLDEGVTNCPSVGSAGGITCCQGNGAVEHTTFEVGFGKGGRTGHQRC